jgi:serine/threonine protein kinase
MTPMPVSMHSPNGGRPEREGALGEEELAILGAKPLGPDDPDRVGRYELLGVLGGGGMGRVYLGSADERLVAVKVIRAEFADEPEFRTRFARELQAVSRIGGAFTAPLVDAQTEATRPWMATEYVPGLALDDAVTPGAPLPAEAVWRLAGGVAVALVAVHQAGLIHRDLKPGNVILALDGPRLIDFGIARSLDLSQLTMTGQAVGTPSYMAPEQAAAGQVSTASDVFAFGCLLAFAATGVPPFGTGSQMEVAYRIVHAEPDLDAVRQVDPELVDLVARCLDKDPLARPDAAALVAAIVDARLTAEWPDQLRARIEPRARLANQTFSLRGAARPASGAAGSGLTTFGGGAGGLPRKPPVPLPGGRSRWPIALAAAVVAVLAGIGMWAATGGASATRTTGQSAHPLTPSRAKTAGSSTAGPPTTGSPTTAPSTHPSASANTSSTPSQSSPATLTSTVSESGPGAVTTVVTTAVTPTSDASTTKAPSSPRSAGTYYPVRNYHTGWCVVGASDTWVHQAACSTSQYDGWEYTAAAAFQLVNHGNGRCMTYAPGNGNVTIVTEPCNGSDPRQQWNIAAETVYGDELENVGAGSCLWSVGTVGSVTVGACSNTNHSDLWSGTG